MISFFWLLIICKTAKCLLVIEDFMKNPDLRTIKTATLDTNTHLEEKGSGSTPVDDSLSENEDLWKNSTSDWMDISSMMETKKKTIQRSGSYGGWTKKKTYEEDEQNDSFMPQERIGNDMSMYWKRLGVVACLGITAVCIIAVSAILLHDSDTWFKKAEDHEVIVAPGVGKSIMSKGGSSVAGAVKLPKQDRKTEVSEKTERQKRTELNDDKKPSKSAITNQTLEQNHEISQNNIVNAFESYEVYPTRQTDRKSIFDHDDARSSYSQALSRTSSRHRNRSPGSVISTMTSRSKVYLPMIEENETLKDFEEESKFKELLPNEAARRIEILAKFLIGSVFCQIFLYSDTMGTNHRQTLQTLLKDGPWKKVLALGSETQLGGSRLGLADFFEKHDSGGADPAQISALRHQLLVSKSLVSSMIDLLRSLDHDIIRYLKNPTFFLPVAFMTRDVGGIRALYKKLKLTKGLEFLFQNEILKNVEKRIRRYSPQQIVEVLFQRKYVYGAIATALHDYLDVADKIWEANPVEAKKHPATLYNRPSFRFWLEPFHQAIGLR